MVGAQFGIQGDYNIWHADGQLSLLFLLDPCHSAEIPRVDNAQYTNHGNLRVGYECDPGYEMVDPSKAVITCSNGIWSELPVCSKFKN